MNKIIIWFDMDGVLANFEQAAKKVDGFKAEFNVATDSLPDDLKKDKEAFWLKIRENNNFWDNLEPIEDGVRLWGLLRHLQPRILTAAPRFNIPEEEVFFHPWYLEVKEKKLVWAKKNLNISDDDFFCTISKLKHLYIEGDENIINVLIDDRMDNINHWEKNGGVGIFFKNFQDASSQIMTLFPKLIIKPKF